MLTENKFSSMIDSDKHIFNLSKHRLYKTDKLFFSRDDNKIDRKKLFVKFEI